MPENEAIAIADAEWLLEVTRGVIGSIPVTAIDSVVAIGRKVRAERQTRAADLCRINEAREKLGREKDDQMDRLAGEHQGLLQRQANTLTIKMQRSHILISSFLPPSLTKKLKRAKIDRAWDLMQETEENLRKIRGVGSREIQRISNELYALGLYLKNP